MRVFSTLIPWSMRTRVAWELASESLHESFLKSFFSRVNENKSCMTVGKREFAWVFSAAMPWSRKTRVTWKIASESLHESFLNCYDLVNKKSCIRVGKREFEWEFLKCDALINENKSCMRVCMREFAWEFSQILFPDQWKQELHESW